MEHKKGNFIISYNAPVILTFALISLAALGISALTNGASNRLLFSVYGRSWTDPLGYLRLFGHILGHANLNHYVSNFLIILLIGPIIEERYSSKQLAAMIAATALATGLFSALFQPNVALLGASGIAFMLILLGSFTNAKTGSIPLTMIFAIVIYIGREIVAGTANLMGITSDNISQITHIIGGVCGLIFGFALNRTHSK
jgi:membrane associated rhomboid family serine protease